MIRWTSYLAALAVVSFAPALVLADDQAKKIAEKVTTEGAATFDTYNAKAMAAYYEEGAVLTLIKNDNGDVTLETHEGRAAIEKAYAKLFEKPEPIKSRNTVDHARLIGSDVLTIDGTFDINTLKADSIKVAFHQVRVKKNDKWQILIMEISLLPNN